MQTITLENYGASQSSKAENVSFFSRVQEVVDASELNRFGVVAALILLQVTIAGFNVVIPPMTGASTYLMAPGIFMAFISNGIALAQMQMKWVLLGFALSMLINAAVSIYCFGLYFS